MLICVAKRMFQTPVKMWVSFPWETKDEWDWLELIKNWPMKKNTTSGAGGRVVPRRRRAGHQPGAPAAHGRRRQRRLRLPRRPRHRGQRRHLRLRNPARRPRRLQRLHHQLALTFRILFYRAFIRWNTRCIAHDFWMIVERQVRLVLVRSG